MATVSEMRKVLALVDDLKPLVKRTVSDDKLFAVCAKHICKSDKVEVQTNTAESAK